MENEEDIFILDKLIKDNPDDYRQVLDFFPGMLHVNSSIDFSILHTNSFTNKKMGMTTEEIRNMGPGFISSFVHPDTLAYEVPKIKAFYEQTDGKDSYAFFQLFIFPGDDEYTTLFTVTKAIPEFKIYVTNINLVPEMGENSHKLERVLKQQEYVRRNLKAFHSLTKRELQLLTLLAKGNNNPAISEQLFISRHTVEKHRKNMNKKLGIKNFADLFAFAQAFDLI
jgi:DNA-binding CsgD family transcriptional regulator